MDTIRTRRVGPAPHIAVDHCGSGDLVLFLHGIGGNRSNWKRQLIALSEHFNAAAWDARGYGESDDYDGPFTSAVAAEDAIRVIDSFGSERAHLVGLSLGGRLCQEIYHRYPDRVLSLTLADTSPGLLHAMTLDEAQALLESRRRPLLDGGSPADTAAAVARTLVSARASAGAFEEIVASLSAVRPRSYLKVLDTLLEFDRQAELANIRVPVNVVVGADDCVAPPSVARELARAVGYAEMVVIPDAGHISNIDQPEAFNRCAMDFLMRVGGGTGPA